MSVFSTSENYIVTSTSDESDFEPSKLSKLSSKRKKNLVKVGKESVQNLRKRYEREIKELKSQIEIYKSRETCSEANMKDLIPEIESPKVSSSDVLYMMSGYRLIDMDILRLSLEKAQRCKHNKLQVLEYNSKALILGLVSQLVFICTECSLQTSFPTSVYSSKSYNYSINSSLLSILGPNAYLQLVKFIHQNKYNFRIKGLKQQGDQESCMILIKESEKRKIISNYNEMKSRKIQNIYFNCFINDKEFQVKDSDVRGPYIASASPTLTSFLSPGSWIVKLHSKHFITNEIYMSFSSENSGLDPGLYISFDGSCTPLYLSLEKSSIQNNENDDNGLSIVKDLRD